MILFVKNNIYVVFKRREKKLNNRDIYIYVYSDCVK